jgi:preprotein translocase subunit SecD
MKKLLILIPLFLYIISCSDDDVIQKEFVNPDSTVSKQSSKENDDEMLDEFTEESFDILYYKINIYDILTEMISDDRLDDEVRKILEIAKKAEEDGENSYNIFISEFNKNKNKLKKLSHYFRWDPNISDDIISNEMYNAVFEETQDIGAILNSRLKKLGLKNTRMELLKGGVVKVMIPKGTPISSINDIILKPGRVEFALVKNDKSIPEIIYDIDIALTPERLRKIEKKGIQQNVFSNLLVTYYISKDRKSKPIVTKYTENNFPEGFYYFSYYDFMQEDLKKYISKKEVKDIIPKNLMILSTNTPKKYYSEASKKTFGIYDMYFIQKNTTISGDIIKDAYFSYDINKKPAVYIELNNEAGKKLEKLTKDNIGKNIAIILDSKVYDAPIVRTSIEDGKVMISNIRSVREAKMIETILKSGSYDFPVYEYEPKEPN